LRDALLQVRAASAHALALFQPALPRTFKEIDERSGAPSQHCRMAHWVEGHAQACNGAMRAQSESCAAWMNAIYRYLQTQVPDPLRGNVRSYHLRSRSPFLGLVRDRASRCSRMRGTHRRGSQWRLRSSG
jgi:hypothetical protein